MENTRLIDITRGRILHKAAPTDTVRKACIMMSSANVGALPVTDENGFLVGMISERDVIKRSVIVYRPSDETLVSKVMTPDPKWLPPDAVVEDAVELMRCGRFRHILICTDGLLIGIVSIRDIVLGSGKVPQIPVRTAALDTRARSGNA